MRIKLTFEKIENQSMHALQNKLQQYSVLQNDRLVLIVRITIQFLRNVNLLFILSVEGNSLITKCTTVKKKGLHSCVPINPYQFP